MTTRRGFMAAAAALFAVPAMAWERPKRRFRLPPSAPGRLPEYRWRGGYVYMRAQRTYWRRPRRAPHNEWMGSLPWAPCRRSEFYRASLDWHSVVQPPRRPSIVARYWDAWLKSRRER